MNQNTAQKRVATPQEVSAPVQKTAPSTSSRKRMREQARTLVQVCSLLFAVSMGVMFYLYGKDRSEMERNRKNVLVKHREDARIERDLMRNAHDLNRSGYMVDKNPRDSNLVPADESKSMIL